MAQAAPGLFTSSEAGWGRAAAVNADGTINDPTNPVKIGAFISLYATGTGQNASAITVTVGSVPAAVDYGGLAPGQVPGLILVNLRIPAGVQPGGYVPVVLKAGDISTVTPVWIAVAGN